MADYVVMPKKDWQDALNATREKTGKSAGILSEELGAQIRSIPSGNGGITPSGTKRITENGTYDVMGYASAEIDVETPTEELTVTENGDYTPPAGTHYSAVYVEVPDTPTEELTVTENGDYTPPAGKHYSKVTVNVEAEGGSDSGEPENLSAELTEQDGLLTSIESMLKLATVTLSVSFAEEYEDWENSDGEMIYKPFSVTGSYTVDGDHTVYFEKAPSLEIPCSVGSVIEIVYDRWYEYGRAYRDAQGVNVEEFYVETEEEQNACFRITVTESDASVTLYNRYG